MGTRQRIVAAARQVCEEVGADRLTMRRVGAAAGITAAAIYRHFAGKPELLEALVDQANDRMSRYIERGGAGATPWERLRGTLDSLFDFALEDPTSYDILFFSRERSDEELLPHELRSPNFRTWLSRVEECRASGALRPDLDAMEVAITLWAFGHGLLALHVQGRFAGSVEVLRRHLDQGLDHLLQGIATGDARR